MEHKKGIISLCIIIAIVFIARSIFYDPDNYRISKRIFYHSQRKDILDYNGKYEIPPIVTGYTKTGHLILVKWNPDYPLDAIYDKYDYNAWYSEDSIILYWAIDLNEEKQIGPMDSIEFENYCESKGILDNLDKSMY